MSQYPSGHCIPSAANYLEIISIFVSNIQPRYTLIDEIAEEVLVRRVAEILRDPGKLHAMRSDAQALADAQIDAVVGGHRVATAQPLHGADAVVADAGGHPPGQILPHQGAGGMYRRGGLVVDARGAAGGRNPGPRRREEQVGTLLRRPLQAALDAMQARRIALHIGPRRVVRHRRKRYPVIDMDQVADMVAEPANLPAQSQRRQVAQRQA